MCTSNAVNAGHSVDYEFFIGVIDSASNRSEYLIKRKPTKQTNFFIITIIV